MKTDLNINFLISKISQSASKDRKIFGGTYKTLFYFTGIEDYFQIYGNGLYQAVGRDNEHTYFKTWNNSSFAGVEPQDIFKQLGSFINRIEVYGCGNEYKKLFPSFKSFLDWIEVNPADAGIQIIDNPAAEENTDTNTAKDVSKSQPDKKTSADEKIEEESPENKNSDTGSEKKISEPEVKTETPQINTETLKKTVVIIDNNVVENNNATSSETNTSDDK